MKALFCILALALCFSLFAVIPEAPAVGNGSPDNPFRIANFPNLYWLTQTPGVWNQHFIQTANIDAADSDEISDPAPNTSGWIPIGCTSPYFTGTYDGQGYQIHNLYMHRPSQNYAGLFGYMIGARISRINLRNVSITGAQYTGGLAGVANSNSVVNSCSVTGAVNGTVNVGGILGYCDNSGATNSYSHASVYCSSDQVGGFVGLSGWNNPSYYNFCYSTGTVTAPGTSYKNGFMGRSGSNTARDCYWDTQSSGIATDPVATGKNTAQMKSQYTFFRWNFHHQWSIQEGVAYPNLDNLLYYALPAVLTTDDLMGSGTETDPYVILSADQLNVIRQAPDAHFILWANIDLEASVGWNQGTGWEPIGNPSTPFTGTLSGNGFTISGLTICRPRDDNQGLFGYTLGATVGDFDLINCHILGKSNIGGAVGYAKSSSLDEIQFDGTMLAFSASGGIAGVLDNTTLQRSYAQIDLKSFSDYAGGLAGYITSTGTIGGSLSNSGSSGNIEGVYNVGGAVGMISWGYILNSYSHCLVNGTYNIGGLVGTLGWSNPGYISRCFSTGLVSLNAGGNSNGGLLGRQMAGAIRESYWDSQSSGLSSNSGSGAVPKTTAEMQQESTFARWNFGTIWQIEAGEYPTHQDLSLYGLPQALEIGQLLGSGTESDPYLIENADQLNIIREAPGAHYALAEDLDLSATCVWNGGRAWEPIGTSSAPFTGSLNGAGHLLANLSIERPDTDYSGLFGYVSGGKITSIIFSGVNLLARNYLGSVAGYAVDSRIDMIEADGYITGNDYVGGIAGTMHRGTIQRSTVDMTLWAQGYYSGLIAGSVSSDASFISTISTCESRGAVRGVDNVGGLVGFLSYGSVINSSSHAAVSGHNYLGGAVGTCGWSEQGAIVRSYSTGTVVSEISGFGVFGFVGRMQSGQVYDCYWDSQSSGLTLGGHSYLTGLTTMAMKQSASYQNWNFDSLWDITEGAEYPYLRDLSVYQDPGNLTIAELIGSGTPEDPYLIMSSDQLNIIRQNLSAHYRIHTDLDLSATLIWNGGRGWLPLGSPAEPFTGSIDGDGKIIHGLSIMAPLSSNIGFIGLAQNATISDLKLTGVSIVAEDYSGALAGVLNYCTTIGAEVEVEHTGAGFVGGLVGLMTGGTLESSSAKASLLARNYHIGGLLGYMQDNAQVSLCSTTGSVKGYTLVGGIVGDLNHGTVSDSYSHAAVQATQLLGGIAGRLGWGNAGHILNCYATGAITINPGGYDAGGVAGQLYYGSISGSYWDINTTGISTSPGGTGATGLTTQQMTWPASQSYFSGWDFTDTWRHDNIGQNSGYPYLAWQGLPIPDAVQNLQIVSVGDQLILQWSAVADVNLYRIYSSEDPYLPFAEWNYLGQSSGTSYQINLADKAFYIVKSVIE